MLGIKNNLMAEVATRHLNSSYADLAVSVQRLSSGLRINSAKDDAAGLAVRELIRADVAALRQGSRNAADGVSMLQVGEGGLAIMDNILIRMRELTVQAATDTLGDRERGFLNREYNQLTQELDRIGQSTEFNGLKMFDPNNEQTELVIQVGTKHDGDAECRALHAALHSNARIRLR